MSGILQGDLRNDIAGVAAAVVGIIAAIFVQLGITAAGAVERLSVGLALFGLAAVAAWRLKGAWVTPAIIAGGGMVGWLLVA